MKKFTLMAGLVALATVGSVFAAWTFASGDIKDEASLANGIGVQLLDKDIETNGASGTLTLTNSGNNSVKIVQGNPGQYTFKFAEEGTAEAFTATYTAGIGEQTDEITYEIEFSYVVKYNTTALYTVTDTYGTELSGDKKISFNNTTLVATSDLSLVFAKTENLTKIGLATNSLSAMKTWLEANPSHASKLSIEVSAKITPNT